MKSKLAISLFIQMLMLNKPTPKNGKKPLIIFYSFEEPISSILFSIWEYLRALDGLSLEYTNEKPKAIVEYINNKLGKYFKFMIFKRNPNTINSTRLRNEITKLSEDYEIYAVFFDYLDKIQTDDIELGNGPIGSDLIKLFNLWYNYAVKMNIFILNLHQLASSVNGVSREGFNALELLKRLDGKNHTKGSGNIGDEINGEMILVKGDVTDYGDSNGTYLICALGKHKGSKIHDRNKKIFGLQLDTQSSSLLADTHTNKEPLGLPELEDIFNNGMF